MQLDATTNSINSANLPNADTASTDSISSQNERVSAIFTNNHSMRPTARPLTDINRIIQSMTRDDHNAINERIARAATHISMSQMD